MLTNPRDAMLDNRVSRFAFQVKQETQLSLTNRATHVEVTKYGTIPYVRYGFLLVCYSNFVPKTEFHIFDFKK